MHLRCLHHIADFLVLLIAQLHLQRSQVFFEILDLLRPRDRDDILPLPHQPRQRQLPGGTPFLLCNCPKLIHQLQVLLEVLPLEARGHASKVVLVEIIRATDLAGHEASPKRGVSDGGDAKLAAGFEEGDLRVFNVEGKGGVFDLDSGDVVDFAGAAEGGGGDFGEAEVFDFAGSLKLSAG